MMDDRNKSYIANSKNHGNGKQEMLNNINRSLACYRSGLSLRISNIKSNLLYLSHGTTINPNEIVKEDVLVNLV